MYEDVALELAIIERLAREAVRRKIASQQLGEAWVDLFVPAAPNENSEEASPLPR